MLWLFAYCIFFFFLPSTNKVSFLLFVVYFIGACFCVFFIEICFLNGAFFWLFYFYHPCLFKCCLEVFKCSSVIFLHVILPQV